MAATMWAPVSNATPGSPIVSKLVLSFLGALLFVFHLRVFDDVKDADTDRVIEPTRPIPRGLVSEREVDALSVVLLLVEAGLYAAIGQLTFVIWLIAAGFTVLMRVEFFVGEWLDKHVLTYAISHMVSMGLVFGSLIAAGIDTLGMAKGVGATDVLASSDIVIVCIGAFALGVGFELGRKFERYAGAHGTAGWILLAACPTLAVGLFAYASTELVQQLGDHHVVGDSRAQPGWPRTSRGQAPDARE